MQSDDKWFEVERFLKNQLNGIGEDDTIYRIFSYPRFLQLLTERQLVLVKPHKWDDPFENYLYSAEATSSDGISISLSNLRETVFGQCWSLEEESDAMWRIYSPNKDGVKVRTTAGKLFHSFWSGITNPLLKCYIGKVLYWDQSEIVKLVTNPTHSNAIIFDGEGIEQAKSFLIKRKEFKHEQEVRLLYTTTPSAMECKIDKFIVTIDPFNIIDEIVFDPRIEKSVFNALKIAIEQLGFKKEILRSSLYELPDMKVRINLQLKKTEPCSSEGQQGPSHYEK